jgi:NodT family efflux transporter outer membrane factor (OMF) lipoprotein
MTPHKKILPDGPRRLWADCRRSWALPAVLALAAVLICAGCAPVGPDYQQVAPSAPATWHTELDQGLRADRPDFETLARWWTVLNDPLLTNLEERAVAGNLTLKEAESRIREARALRGISQAGLWPDLTASASATRTRASKNNSGTGSDKDLYAVGFDAGWELDVFGGRRRAVEAAQADLEASQEELHDALVTLLAEVALNYVDLRAGQARLAVAEANIAAQQHTYDLNLSRYQAGLIDELAVQQSLYNLEHSRSQVPVLEIGLAAARNRLAILLGKSPGGLDKELAQRRSVPVPPLTVAVGVPADTLRHRPDIRRAERVLAARTARIGVATADLYPQFRLPGSIGLESTTSSDLLEWGSRTWSFGPQASWRLFDAGAIRQNVKVQTQRQEQALLQYEAVILNALEEVENALVSYAKEQRRRDALIKATEAARQADLLARDQYKAGLVDFSNVLDAQRSLLAFEDELALSEGSVTADLLRLYKALGGGWESMATGIDQGKAE